MKPGSVVSLLVVAAGAYFAWQWWQGRNKKPGGGGGKRAPEPKAQPSTKPVDSIQSPVDMTVRSVPAFKPPTPVVAAPVIPQYAKPMPLVQPVVQRQAMAAVSAVQPLAQASSSKPSASTGPLNTMSDAAKKFFGPHLLLGQQLQMYWQQQEDDATTNPDGSPRGLGFNEYGWAYTGPGAAQYNLQKAKSMGLYK